MNERATGKRRTAASVLGLLALASALAAASIVVATYRMVQDWDNSSPSPSGGAFFAIGGLLAIFFFVLAARSSWRGSFGSAAALTVFGSIAILVIAVGDLGLGFGACFTDSSTLPSTSRLVASTAQMPNNATTITDRSAALCDTDPTDHIYHVAEILSMLVPAGVAAVGLGTVLLLLVFGFLERRSPPCSVTADWPGWRAEG